MAFLKVTKGPFVGQVVALQGNRLILGRHPTSQIFLEDGAVSGQHAEIVQEDGKFFIGDMRTRCGTLVNGVKIKIDSRTELREGDEIRIVDHAFEFRLQPDSEDACPEVKRRAVPEITSEFGRVLNLKEVLPAILKSLFKIFQQADAGFVLLQDSNTHELRVEASLCQNPNDDEVAVSMTVVRQAMEQREEILSADVQGDRRFRSSESLTDLRLRSLMCAPLLATDGRAMGVIQLSTLEVSKPFTCDDLDLLVSVSAQAALAVENATR